MTTLDLSPITDSIPELSAIVGEIEGDSPDPMRLLHLKFRENEPLLHEFVELLGEQLVNYVVPVKRRREASEHAGRSATGSDTSRALKLYHEAVRTLIKYREDDDARYGEIGELISYVLAVQLLGAAQVASKMTLKTSGEMAVHGSDGLHLRANPDGSVTFFLLESKIGPQAGRLISEFCKSIGELRKSRRAKLNELQIAHNLSNLDALSGDAREEALAYFNPYQKGSERRERFVGSLVYSEKSYADRVEIDDDDDIGIHEAHFCQKYKVTRKRHQVTLERNAERRALNLEDCHVFLLAVPDTTQLKKLFAEHHSGHIR